MKNWKISFGKIVDQDDKVICGLPKRENNDAAHLIAAAPELLLALESLLEDHKRMFPEAHPHSTIKWSKCIEVEAATAAIAKAKGESK